MCQLMTDPRNRKGSAAVNNSSSLIFTSPEQEKEESRFLAVCHKTAGPVACAAGIFIILLVSETCPDPVLGTQFPGKVFAGLLGGIAGLVFFLRWLTRKLTSGDIKKADNGHEKDDR